MLVTLNFELRSKAHNSNLDAWGPDQKPFCESLRGSWNRNKICNHQWLAYKLHKVRYRLLHKAFQCSCHNYCYRNRISGPCDVDPFVFSVRPLHLASFWQCHMRGNLCPAVRFWDHKFYCSETYACHEPRCKFLNYNHLH